ncbi:MAG: hypothetical protein ACLRZ7_02395 [Lachnospiraceae bacterium]
MKKKRQFTQRLFYAYSTVILFLLILFFTCLLIFVYKDRYQKEINSQQELVVDRTTSRYFSAKYGSNHQWLVI